jgi:hypothetical protein
VLAVSIPEFTRRRVEVLELRIRLERLAAACFDEACNPSDRGVQAKIDKRLGFLLHHVSEDQFSRAYGLIRLGRHVYARSSDVMHGRTSMVNVPQVVVDEWRQIVGGLEGLLDECRQQQAERVAEAKE